jgi:sporulation protein YlmC with PRC-barrel domain
MRRHRPQPTAALPATGDPAAVEQDKETTMKKVLCATAVVLGLLMASPAMAVEGEAGPGGPRPMGGTGPDAAGAQAPATVFSSQVRFDQPLIRSGQFIGNTVRGAEGNEIGKVSQVLFEAESGQVRYLVVSTAGAEGLAEGEYLVPWPVVNTDPEGRTIALDIPADRFRNAPKGLAIGPEEQARELHRFYGVAPYWEGAAEREREIERESEPRPENSREPMTD